MSATGSAITTTPPLFYTNPEVLDFHRHMGLHLHPHRNFSFTKTAASVPIATTEFVNASAHYPIVFVGEQAHPAVVLSLQNENLFLDKDGQWSAGTYIPFYVRRYPFIVMSASGTSLVLGFDRSSDRITPAPDDPSSGSEPFFIRGRPSPTLEAAQRLCGEFHRDGQLTAAFSRALLDARILIERTAKVVLPGEQDAYVQGFRIIDEAEYRKLPEAVVVQWHRNGWLDLAALHMASQSRWQILIARRAILRAARGNNRAPAANATISEVAGSK